MSTTKITTRLEPGNGGKQLTYRFDEPPDDRGPALLEHPIRVIGVDPGSIVAGYGVVDYWPNSGRITYVECGTLTAPRKRPIHKRLREIADALREVLAELQPERAAVEKVHMAKHGNVQSVIHLARAQGVVIEVLGDLRGDAVSEWQPAAWRKVLGSGRLDKEQVRTLVMMFLKLKVPPALDASDALGLAFAGASEIGGKAVKKPPAAAPTKRRPPPKKPRPAVTVRRRAAKV